MNKKKILVVDDEGAMTRMLKRTLEATNRYDVRTENTSSAAISAAAEFAPDLILMDVMMPELDGGEVAERLKDNKILANIPIVFLSAIVKKEETQSTGSNFGGLTFLAKPVNMQDLITCIENHLGK